MNRHLIAGLIAGALILVFAGVHAEPKTQSGSKPASDLAWLSGCWQHNNGATREIWSESYYGLKFGYAVSRRNQQVTFFEDLRIEPSPDGLILVAYPGGKQPTRFVESSLGAQSVSFDNPNHDFPQRITYQRGPTGLTATISTLDGARSTTFEMVICRD